jgi:hypothetical protein
MDSRPLNAGWLQSESASESQPEALAKQKLATNEEALQDLDKKLRSKKTKLTGHNLTRHRAVQAFLRYQETKKEGETRDSMSLSVARCFRKDVHFARMIVSWERQWIAHRKIERQVGVLCKDTVLAKRRGCSATCSGVAGKAKEPDITGYGLAKVIGRYLSSSRAASTLGQSFGTGENRIRARTARNWLNKMGFISAEVRKGAFVDGHERKDVVDYRDNIFPPAWKDYERRMVVFSGEAAS